MTTSDWAAYAARIIKQAVLDARAQGLSPTETVKLIDSRYPFGPRSHHPYAMWLKARKEALQFYGLPDTRSRYVNG